MLLRLTGGRRGASYPSQAEHGVGEHVLPRTPQRRQLGALQLQLARPDILLSGRLPGE